MHDKPESGSPSAADVPNADLIATLETVDPAAAPEVAEAIAANLESGLAGEVSTD